MGLILSFSLPLAFTSLFRRVALTLWRCELLDGGLVVFPRMGATAGRVRFVYPIAAPHPVLLVLSRCAIGLCDFIRAMPFLP